VPELLQAVAGSGPYIGVFIGMGLAMSWLLKDRTRILTALEKSNERLLEEREKRTLESLETARLLSASSQKLADHTKALEKVLDRWPLSSIA
jgi:hypothetical protein